MKRAPSPCPCKSEECDKEYEEDKRRYKELLQAVAKGEKVVLPHASGMYMYPLMKPPVKNE